MSRAFPSSPPSVSHASKPAPPTARPGPAHPVDQRIVLRLVDRLLRAPSSASSSPPSSVRSASVQALRAARDALSQADGAACRQQVCQQYMAAGRSGRSISALCPTMASKRMGWSGCSASAQRQQIGQVCDLALHNDGTLRLRQALGQVAHRFGVAGRAPGCRRRPPARGAALPGEQTAANLQVQHRVVPHQRAGVEHAVAQHAQPLARAGDALQPAIFGRVGCGEGQEFRRGVMPSTVSIAVPSPRARKPRPGGWRPHSPGRTARRRPCPATTWADIAPPSDRGRRA